MISALCKTIYLLLAAGGVLALVGLLAVPSFAQAPGVNLEALAAQVSALQNTVNSQQATINAQAAAISSLQNSVTTLQSANTGQATTIQALQKLTSPLSLSGIPGTYPATLKITGVNVQIVNGLGATDGNPQDPFDDFNTSAVNGLGNLIIGYNESLGDVGGTDVRTGSHNLILGDGNSYSGFGAFVGGTANFTQGPYCSIFDGQNGSVSAYGSEISGGLQNKIDPDGFYAAIAGSSQQEINSDIGFLPN